jgi:hypothetical protein
MARTSAATQSTAAQKGGHHRVFVTNWVRYCQASLIPCAANPATRNHADPVTPTAATTTNAAVTVVSTAMTFHRPSATANPM